MDPNICFAKMLADYGDGDFESARECAMDLREWLDKGGFYPMGYVATGLVLRLTAQENSLRKGKHANVQG